MEPQADSARGTSTRPRLFIKEMVMRNFKSYAGEQRVGPFHKVSVFNSCFFFHSIASILLCEFEIRLWFWRVFRLWLDLMGVEKVTWLMLCCLCSGSERSRFVFWDVLETNECLWIAICSIFFHFYFYLAIVLVWSETGVCRCDWTKFPSLSTIRPITRIWIVQGFLFISRRLLIW